MEIKKVLKEELSKISLSNQELTILNNQANELIKTLSKSGIKFFIGGSLAKNTMIKKNTQDIDVFAMFKDEKEISDKLEKILQKNKPNYIRIHGSRDYFQIKEGNLTFEIIPVVDSEDAKNITDFSLTHVNYVKNKIKKSPKLADEIKLAKAFCFAQNCYGAESYINGFSGYALEILIVYFGSFINFIKKIKKQTIIDPEKHFKNKEQINTELNGSKLQSPITIIDPTYKFRNAAAGLSKATFEKFLDSAEKFLKSPSTNFFEKKELDVEKIKKQAKTKKAKFIEILLTTEKQEGDIAGTKMKKFSEFITQELEKKQQKVLTKEFVYESGQEAKLYLIVKEKNQIEIRGPSLKMKEAVQSFKRIRHKIIQKSGFAWAKEKISLDDIFSNLKRFEQEMSVNFEVI